MWLLHDGEHNAEFAIDATITALLLWTFDNASDLIEYDRPFGKSLDRYVFELLYHLLRLRSKTTEDTDRSFRFTRDCETTAGVDVAFSQGLLDFLDRDFIFQKCSGID